MKKDIEQINVDFNTAAKKHYFNVCNRLEKAAASFSRRQDETEYLQLHAMYLELLRMNLETEALTIMDKYKSGCDLNQLQKALTLHIDRYVSEFRFKYRMG